MPPDRVCAWLVVTPPAPQPTRAAIKARRRAERAQRARIVARSVQQWADTEPPERAVAAQLTADAAYEIAEAWFWLAGGDAEGAWERRRMAQRLIALCRGIEATETADVG